MKFFYFFLMNFSLNSNTVKFTKILVFGNQPSRPFMSQSLSVKPHGSTTTIRCQLWGMRPSMPRWRTTRPTRRVQLWKRPMELLAARRQCIEPCVNQSKSQLHFLLISKHGHTKSQILTLYWSYKNFVVLTILLILYTSSMFITEYIISTECHDVP